MNQPHPKLAQRVLDVADDVLLRRSDLDHVEYNPRQISQASFKRLCDSVRRFGLVVKPVVNRRSQAKGFDAGSRMVIVGGNQRIDACDSVLETQDYKIRCSLIDVDATTEKEICIALNNPTMQGMWDVDLLSETIASIRDDGGDVRDTGFSVNDLRTFMDDAAIGMESGEAAEQQAAESGTVDMLGAMFEAGKESSGSCGDESNSGSGKHVDLFGDEAGGEDGGEESDEPDPQTIRDDLKRKRAKYKGQQDDYDSADFTIHLVFDDRRQMMRFIDEFGLDPAKRFIDGVDFTRTVLDVDLRAGE